MIVGALAVALGAVTLMVVTGNQIADRKNEVAALEARQAAAEERAAELAPYAQFASMSETRATTVDDLARSRFDWERVLREFALVIPEGIQVTNVTGSVVPGVQISGGAASPLREDAPGPALEVQGCAPTQDAVAELASSLEDIDGVTRVGVNRSSNVSEDAATAGGTGADACETDEPVFAFELVAAFDEVTIAASSPEAPDAEPSATEASAETPEPEGESVTDARAQEDQARSSTEQQSDKAKDAAGLIPGVAR
jgi:Tfp pilus assembly protein PilN